MINVSNNLNFKTILCDLDYKTGFFDMKKLKRKVNKKTVAVVLTNMFNTYEQSLKLKKFCKSKKISLIEDNAIYFDNFKILKNKKKYSGIHGDFTLYSFNIMKNISALYGGAATSNNKDFALFSREEIENFKNFPKIILIKQVFIFFLLKTLSIVFLYRLFFFRMIRLVYIHKIKFVLRLFYPVLKFKIRKLPNYYFTKIPFLSKKLIFYQLTDIERRNKNHQKRKMKNIYYFNKFLKFKIKDVKLLDIRDFNYQNFVDFPILVKNRERLNKFLLNKGIETRLYYYKNCGKIFKKEKQQHINAQKYEDEIICLPNNEKITYEYMDYIAKNISLFYSNKAFLKS